jgi:CheY-like chemotaxis protein
VTTARILLVDDDRDLVEVLRIVLEGHGYNVLASYSAAEALAAVQSEKPDLVVLDVMMPDATEGFHVVWNLRRREEAYYQELPIIMLTAIHGQTQLRFYPDAGDGTYEAGEYLPVQGFVDKPVEPDALVKEVERVLNLVHGP